MFANQINKCFDGMGKISLFVFAISTGCSDKATTSPAPEIDSTVILEVLLNVPSYERPIVTPSNQNNPYLIETLRNVDYLIADRYYNYELWVTFILVEDIPCVSRWASMGKRIEIVWEAYHSDYDLDFQLIASLNPIYVLGDTVRFEIQRHSSESLFYPITGYIIPIKSKGSIWPLVSWRPDNGNIRYGWAGGDRYYTLIDTIEGGSSFKIWDTFGLDFRTGWDLQGHGWFATRDTSGVW